MNPAYSIKCPKCGAELDCIALTPDTAPYLCDSSKGCGLGFFAVELSDGARAAYISSTNSWAPPSGRAIAEKVQQELAEALKRGTSLRADQLGVASRSALVNVTLMVGVDEAFLSSVREQIRNSGAAQ